MNAAEFPIGLVRARFPALAATDEDRPRVYFDAPGGTQACADAIDAMADHLRDGTANSGGRFATSVATDALSREAHAAVADLLGGDASEIAFGPNMTTLTLAVSRALARGWREGDELVVTRLDHDANVAPWLRVAEDRGMTVRWLDIDPADGTLRLDDLPALLGSRTRLVAVGGASNALGTLNDLPTIVDITRRHSDALIFVDGVQSVPHVPTDVRAIGCDLLACSPYKMFGPHQGVLWGRAELLGDLEAYKVRPASTRPAAVRFETGTPSFEGQAGVLGMIAYLEWLGSNLKPAAATRRDRLLAAMAGCADYERALSEQLLAGLARFERIRLYGPPRMDGRVPTFAFTVEGRRPEDVAQHLADCGVFAWSGHFYAVEVVAALGLAEAGGLVRVGLCHYNTAGEVDTLLDALSAL
ncbi:MAG: Cysteine desulfurase [uncultured Sphingomonas sp.]|uniref:Cysteine desulfurase n=1 Tax=uncultured Sphingomonas sp. TaxID=158754 RepID=A0A6J4TGB1_9SPHN|nr:cysteine desulfurase-like protein [uncultured Sphingomonas sp.]CAA9521826.1 MAG: Cysteine desulfurase [uncultured Sphingomonas sp.]